MSADSETELWDAWPGPPITRLGALGDIHGCHEALAAALEFFSSAGVDLVVSVGDIVDGAGDVGACIDLLKAAEVLTVRGNHERWFLANTMRSLPHATRSLSPGQRAFLSTLPTTARLPTACGPLLVCHGTGANDMAGLKPESRGYDILPVRDAIEERPDLFKPDLFALLAGHTHRTMARKLGPLWFFNAGTLLDDPESGFLILDFAERRFERFVIEHGATVVAGESSAF